MVVSSVLLAKSAPILLPIGVLMLKKLLAQPDGLGNEVLDKLIELSGEKLGDTLKKKFQANPASLELLGGEHCVRYTGKVLGAMIEDFAKKDVNEAHRAELLKLAAEAPAGWETFLKRGSPGLTPDSIDTIFSEMAAALQPGVAEQVWQEVPFMKFFSWHVRLGPEVASRLEAYLREDLKSELVNSLVSSDPAAEAAYKTVILARLRTLEEKVDDLRDSPGYDLAGYAQTLVDHYQRIPLADNTTGLTLHRVFVEPNVRSFAELDPEWVEMDADTAAAARAGQFDGMSPELKLRAERLHALCQEQQARPAGEAIMGCQTGGHILLGDAGNGKTSLLRHWAIDWALSYLGETDTVEGEEAKPLPPVPLLIELRKYAKAFGEDSTLTLLDYMERSGHSIARLDRRWCRHDLINAGACLLLDGLDEVTSHDTRLAIAKDASQLCENGARVIVTSRKVGFIRHHWLPGQEASGSSGIWEGWLLQEFDAAQRTLFIQRAHQFLYASEQERREKSEALQRRIDQTPAIERLSTNPLLLTLICVLHRSRGIGATRRQIFTAATDMLVEQWEISRTDGERGEWPPYTPPPEHADKLRVLSRLALDLVMSAPAARPAENLFTLDQLKKTIIAIYDPCPPRALSAPPSSDAKFYSKHLPEVLRERHSILVYAGEDQYSFVHRSFLEFFAARALAEEPEYSELTVPEVLEQIVIGPGGESSPHWRDERFENILPLYMGHQKPGRLQKLLPELLEFPGSDPWYGDRLCFTAECYLEVESRQTHAAFQERLVEALKVFTELYSEHATIVEYLEKKPASVRAVRAIASIIGNLEAGRQWLFEIVRNRGVVFWTREGAVRELISLLGRDDELYQALMVILNDINDNQFFRFAVANTLRLEWGLHEALKECVLRISGDRNQGVLVRMASIYILGACARGEDWLKEKLLTIAEDRDDEIQLQKLLIHVLIKDWSNDQRVIAANIEIQRKFEEERSQEVPATD
jgi:hypothetical protein